MVKKNNYFTSFIFFGSFTFLVCGEKNICLGKRIFCQGAGAGRFWPLGAEAARKKNQEPEPEPLEKKSGAGAAKKFSGSQPFRRLF